MKILPCKTCRKPALATKDGVFQSAGTLHDPNIRYLCRRCGRTSTLTSMEFAQLPEMTAAEIAADSCDLPADAHPDNRTGRIPTTH